MIDLDAIKKRCEAATPGPWDSIRDEIDTGYFDYTGWGKGEVFRCHEIVNSNARLDSEFIRHARTDIPELIAEVERLRGEDSALHDTNRSLVAEVEQLRKENLKMIDVLYMIKGGYPGDPQLKIGPRELASDLLDELQACQFCKNEKPAVCEHGMCKMCGCKSYCWLD